MITDDMRNTLIEAAKEAKKNSYSPYSKFRVGAALLTEEGDIVTGCNVEIASYGLSSCSEQTTIVKMVSEKGPVKVKALAVSTTPDIHAPLCGACRQIIKEFSTPETLIIYKGSKGEYLTVPLTELLPDAFCEFSQA